MSREYGTRNGSSVRVEGRHSGIITVNFDWFEEDACIGCIPDLDETRLSGFKTLFWTCEECGGGEAALRLIHDTRRERGENAE